MNALPRVLRWAEALVAATSAGILALIGFRAATRLELRWDAWWYHLPFAMRRGGLGLAFDPSEIPSAYYQGFPPLPHFVMGVLWRFTGEIRAAGVVNYLALLVFLYLTHRMLRAPIFVTLLVALTAPMVLIHSATLYVDLFGNCWAALAICVLARAYLFEEFESSALLAVGLVSLVAAAWSKVQLVAIVFPALAVYLVAYRPWRSRWGARRRWMIVGFGGGILLASAPYVRNLIVFGNPLWPVDFPIFPGLFVRGMPELRDLMTHQRPPGLGGATQLELFARSILEIGHPTSYPHRHRWIVDQGNAGIAFRSGGFWNVAVIAYLILMGAMLIWLKGRRGLVMSISFALMLLFVGLLPQSHELRYFLFIPLTWAVVIAMLYPLARARGALPASVILATVVALFTTSARLTKEYYRIDPVSYASAARAWGGEIMWPYLGAGHTFCAVGNEPRAFFLTGPTMREFRVASRAEERNCPVGSIPVIGNMVYYNRPVPPR